MKKNLLFAMGILILLMSMQLDATGQATPPSGWGDFKLGLVNDNSNIINVRMKKALSEGVKLHYRYAYVNNGVDPNSNALSWLFSPWTDYSKNSADMGLRPGYVIYMLQEEGGAAALKSNIQNASFMRNYFTSVRIAAEKSNGYKAIFVIEPDTWGYFLQDALEKGTQSDPRQIPATVNNLGAGYEYLAGLPNTLSGVAQATIRTIRRYAPDAYCGLLMSFWSVAANGATGPPVADGAKGMVYWNQGDVDFSANRNVTFANQLLSATERGDFIGVEKNGWSAGNWLVKQNRNDYYWNDTQNAKWVSWSKTLRQGVNLPLLGWQISIGHIGLPNTVNRYEDTFMPYFFTHVPQFIDAGFIGFLAGKGLADCTDFTNANGNELEANGSAGDNGWFFERVKTFDAGRPYIGSGGNNPPSASVTSPANNATFTAPANITISASASDTDGTISKVEFYNGGTKLGEDTSSPYSFAWNSVPAGSYTITARATDNLGATGTSSGVNVTVNGVGPGLPAPWQTADIGAVAATGSASHSNGTFTLQGSGADIWGTADEFRFVYQTLNGNGSIVARVTSLTNTHAWAKSGVMIRESLSANSSHASTVVTPSSGVSSPRRTTTGGTSTSATIAGQTVPKYVKIERNGSTFTSSYSSDGITFTTVSTISISMGTSVYIGLCLSSHSDGVLANSTFTNVTVSGGSSNVAPTASITSPVSGSTFTAPASITINATASDSDGTISKVDFFNGSTLLGTDTSSPYSFTWSGVAAGSYSITARATDNAGGTGTSSAVNITVNTATNVNPTASITSPANGASFTAPASITINASASDSDGTISKVDFFNGSTLLGTDTSSPYSFTWSNVAAGSYSITVQATDNASGTGTSSAVNITVQGASCPAVIASADDGNVAANVLDNNFATRWSASGDGQWIQFCLGTEQSVRGVEIAFYNGNIRSSIFDVLLSVNGTTWSTAATGLRSSGTSTAFESFTFTPQNAKYVRIVGHGNTVNLWNSFTEVRILTGTPTNNAPTASISSPSNGASFTAPASITINATAADTDGTISKVDFYNGSTLLGTDTSSPYSFTWTNVAAGSYTLTARATDNANATGTSSAVSITVNGTSNASPTVSVTSPASGSTFTAPACITINVNAFDSDGTIVKVEFFNGSTKLGEDLTSPYSFTWCNVPAGTYTITARATDNQGAMTISPPVTITVNSPSNVNPSASITSPANNASFTAPASVTINANASDSDGTISKVDFFNGSTLLGTDTSSPYSFTWTNVAAGTYGLTARATDNAGGTGTSAVVNITVSSSGGSCASIPQYVENGGYVPGSLVKNIGNQYECKPWPNSGWCNGGASAYAPGTGTHWGDAWILKGSCTSSAARSSQEPQEESEVSIVDSDGIVIYPIPGKQGDNNSLTLAFESDPGPLKINLKDVNGADVFSVQYKKINGKKVTVSLPGLSEGLYIVRVRSAKKWWQRKYVIR